MGRFCEYVYANVETLTQELHLFTLRFLDGKDYKAICAETDISRIAVWKHLSHIVKVLKENFKTPEP